jgi:hypothetical protein
MYLEKCTDLVNHLKPAFDTRTAGLYRLTHSLKAPDSNPGTLHVISWFQNLFFKFNVYRYKTGIPFGQINLATGKAKNPSWARGASTLAEFGTLQMEFIALSQRTGDPQWEKIAENIVEKVRDVKYSGQVPRGGAVIQAEFSEP